MLQRLDDSVINYANITALILFNVYSKQITRKIAETSKRVTQTKIHPLAHRVFIYEKIDIEYAYKYYVTIEIVLICTFGAHKHYSEYYTSRTWHNEC